MAKKEAAKTVETKTVNTGFIDNVEALEAKMKEMREAQKIFATFTQEQVDKIFYEAAMAANKQRIPLARLAVEETQRGILEDKVIKNHYAAEYIYMQSSSAHIRLLKHLQSQQLKLFLMQQ